MFTKKTIVTKKNSVLREAIGDGDCGPSYD